MFMIVIEMFGDLKIIFYLNLLHNELVIYEILIPKHCSEFFIYK